MHFDNFSLAALHDHQKLHGSNVPDFKITANFHVDPQSRAVPACRHDLKQVLKGYKGTAQMAEYLEHQYSIHSTAHVITTTKLLGIQEELIIDIMKWIMKKAKLPIIAEQMRCYAQQVMENHEKTLAKTQVKRLDVLLNYIRAHPPQHHHDGNHHADNHHHDEHGQGHTHRPPQVPGRPVEGSHHDTEVAPPHYTHEPTQQSSSKDRPPAYKRS